MADFGADATLYSEGVDYLFVNGGLVIDEGEMTVAKPGRLLTAVKGWATPEGAA